MFIHLTFWVIKLRFIWFLFLRAACSLNFVRLIFLGRYLRLTMFFWALCILWLLCGHILYIDCLAISCFPFKASLVLSENPGEAELKTGKLEIQKKDEDNSEKKHSLLLLYVWPSTYSVHPFKPFDYWRCSHLFRPLRKYNLCIYELFVKKVLRGAIGASWVNC